MARRTWKRDLSTNVMPLEAAVDNLEVSAAQQAHRGKERRDRVRRLLERGQVVESELALFELAPDEPEAPYASVNPRSRRLGGRQASEALDGVGPGAVP